MLKVPPFINCKKIIKLKKDNDKVINTDKDFKFDDFITNTLKQKQAIIPNVIHSLDATHLANIINNNNIQIIGIHDCFGALPNEIEILEKSVREEFISLYFIV